MSRAWIRLLALAPAVVAGCTSGPTGIPGCQPTLECLGPCTDAACQEACRAEASAEGLALLDVLGACASANACPDLACTRAACPAEYDACVADAGDGGAICFAEGFYDLCDGAACRTESARGGAWGRDEGEARGRAARDCTDHMLGLVAVGNAMGSARVNTDCAVYECQPLE